MNKMENNSPLANLKEDIKRAEKENNRLREEERRAEE
jgi:hypothetical protein